jgi:pSer/pThr/pTyr-binding forkhead associated (FHA) protein
MDGVLTFMNGPRKGKRIPVNRETFFVGRSSNNNLILEDRSVSRKHAVINFLDEHYTVSDLNSFKGVHVNEVKITEAILQDGDRVRLGSTVFLFTRGSHRRSSFSWKFFVFFTLLLVLIAAAAWHAYGLYIDVDAKLAKIEKVEQKIEHVEELEKEYEKGLKAFNEDKDIEKAKEAWKKVEELDPDGVHHLTRKAKHFLEKIAHEGS